MTRKMHGLNVSLADEASAQMLKGVLNYEAARRGMSLGQVLELLVTQAADVDSYPLEVRERLDEIEQRRRRRAIEDSLAAAGRARIA